MKGPFKFSIIQDFLTHPAVLAIPFLAIFCFFLPDIFDKYKISIVNEIINNPRVQISYDDVNHDGNSERLLFSPEIQKGSALTIYFSGYAYAQWNFDGTLIGTPSFITGDYDNDAHNEVFIFTLKRDSILLQVINYKKKEQLVLENFQLAKVNFTKSGGNDFVLAPVKLVDLNGDGYKELLYVLLAGYSRVPRKLFALDLITKQQVSSPDLGTYALDPDYMYLEKDSNPIFTFGNYAPGNRNDSALKLKDTCSYLAVLDRNLRFIFEPVALNGIYSSISNHFISNKGEHFVASWWNPGANNPDSQSLRIYNLQGDLLRKMNLKSDIMHVKKAVLKGKDVLLVAGKFQKLLAYDVLLKPVSIPEIIIGDKHFEEFDFDCDGEKEFLFKGTSPDKWMICRGDLTHMISFTAVGSFDYPIISSIQKAGDVPRFSLQFGDRELVYQYEKNLRYYWKYPLVAALYLLTLLTLFWIKYLNRLQFKRKYELEKNLLELKIAALQNQMDSHFTFNVLNTIGSTILQDQKHKAYDLLRKFSRMLRRNITDTNSPLRSLEAEMEYVSDFLDLQQSRFSELFEYSIEVDPAIDKQLLVPRGCIQVHAENAVKHGILPLKQGGRLTISVRNAGQYIEIHIVDNGIGRAAANEQNANSTQKGYRIMQSYYEVLNSFSKEPILESIEDLFDGQHNPAGTSVTVSIPMQLGSSVVKGGNLKK